MRRYAFLLLCTALPILGFALENWNTYSLDNQFSLQLPAPPQEIDLAKQGLQQPDMRVFIASDKVGLYQIIRMQVAPDKSDVVASSTYRQDFYDGFARTMVSDMQGKLLARTTFSSPAGDGIEIKIRAPHKATGLKTIKYSRALLVNNVCYGLNFLPRDLQDTAGVSGQQERKQFFTGFTVKVSSGK
jgi:hypothetical protein